MEGVMVVNDPVSFRAFVKHTPYSELRSRKETVSVTVPINNRIWPSTKRIVLHSVLVASLLAPIVINPQGRKSDGRSSVRAGLAALTLKSCIHLYIELP